MHQKNPPPSILFAALFSLQFFYRITPTHSEQRIVIGPSDTRVKVGSDVTLKCKVRDQGGPVIWTHDNFAFPIERDMPTYPRHSMRGATDSFDLSIKRVTLEEDGEYRCHMQQTANDAHQSSDIATLTVLVPPKSAHLSWDSTSGPRAPLTARQGVPISVKCHTLDARPQASVKWAILAQIPESVGKDQSGVLPVNALRVLRYLSEDDNSTDAASVLVKTEGKLASVVSTLRYDAQMSDDGKYLGCIVAHEALDGVRLAAAQLAIEYPPVITLSLVSPSGQSAPSLIEGTRAAHVRCAVQARPPDVNVRWYRNGKKLDWAANQATLTIEEVDRTWHGSEISCEASNAVGSNTESINVNVTYGPRIIDSQSSLLMVAASQGGKVTLTCGADSNPPARVSWASRDKMDKVLHLGNSFTLDPVKEWHAGQYRCTASSPGFPPVHRDITLRIKGPPKVLAFSGEASQNGRAKLTCKVQGFPFASDVIWFKVTQAGLAKIEAYAGNSRVEIRNREVTDGIVSELKVDKVQPADFGAYNCTAVNEFGVDFQLVELRPKDAHSDVTVKVETLDGRDYPTPDMYGAHQFEGLDVSFGKDYVSVPGDNPDCDLLPPPYVQYAGIFRPTPFVPTNNNGTPSAAGTSVGNDFSGGAPRSAIQSPQHQVYGHSPSGDQGGLPVNFGTVPRIQHERQQQQPVFFEEYHGRLVAPNGDIYYATTSGGSPAQSHPPVASGGAATPSILTRPDHPCLHEVPTSSGAIPTSAGITPGYHEYLVPNRPYVPTMASGPGSTALETVVEVQTPDTPRSMCNSNANGAGQLYARHGQWANFQPRDTVITSLRGPPGGQQENLVRKISPTENGTPSSTDV